MQDQEEVTFLFEQSPDNREFILSLVAPDAMTKEDYILALEDFILSLKDNSVDFYSQEASANTH